MHEHTAPNELSERPLDRTWRWIRPESASAPAAQSGTVRALRIVVVGESEPASAPSLPLRSDADWRELSLRDFTEVAHDGPDLRALAFARTLPAIDVASLGLPAPSPASSTRSARRRWSQPSPTIAFGAAAAACVLCVIAATYLVP